MPNHVPPSAHPFSSITCEIGSFVEAPVGVSGVGRARMRKSGDVVMGAGGAHPVTGALWVDLLPYERARIVNWLVQTLMRGSLFTDDSISIVEEEEYEAVSGVGLSVRPFTLCVKGRASIWREVLYRNLLATVREQVADVRCDIRFGIVAGDPLPNVRLAPMNLAGGSLFSSSRTKALHSWQRLGHALKSKIVPLLWGSALQLSTVNNDDRIERIRRFTDLAKDSRIGLRTLVSHRPTMLIFWASYDKSCVDYLRQAVFSREMFGHYMAEEGDNTLHPWSQLVRDNVLVAERTRLKVGTAPLATDLRGASLVFPAPVTNLVVRQESVAEQIVLVCVDSDIDAATQTLSWLVDHAFEGVVDGSPKGLAVQELCKRLVSCVWCGAEGLLSEAATIFDLQQLPCIATVRPEGFNHRVASIGVPPNPSPIFNPQSKWHTVSPGARKDLFGRVSAYLANPQRDLALSVRGVVRLEHGQGVVHTESSYISSSTSKLVSGLRVEGATFDRLIGDLRDDIRRLGELAAHGDNRLVCLASSRSELPLLNPPSWECVATRIEDGDGITEEIVQPLHTGRCSHCTAYLNLFERIYYLCIQCHTEASHCIICERCRVGERHNDAHLLLKCAPWSARGLSYSHFIEEAQSRHPLKVREPQGQIAPLLWGPDNTIALPLVRGALIPSRTNVHLGVLCHRCGGVICGIRWKCACCHDVDLCARCEKEWFSALLEGSLSPQATSPHQPNHVLFRIASAHSHSPHPFANLSEAPL